MRAKIFALIGCLSLALSLSACTGLDGVPQGLPSFENRVTDVGNPNEQETELKGIYINEDFDVAIGYSEGWTVMERGVEEAIFSSDMDESMTAAFVPLDADETLEDFIIDVRGDMDDLVEGHADTFDRTLCADVSEGYMDNVMNIIECYHFRADPENRFVMVFSGYTLTNADNPTVVQFPSEIRSEEKSSSSSKNIDLDAFSNPDAGEPGKHLLRRSTPRRRQRSRSVH